MNRAAQWSLALAICAAPAWADGNAPIIDNQRVEVRKITLMPEQPGMLQSHDRDFVMLVLDGGRIRVTGGNGKAVETSRKFGDAWSGRKGDTEKFELLSAAPATLVEVDLKDHQGPLPANASGYPAAFPRPGTKKVIDNDRVVGWTFTWKPGVTTPMHYHAADIVGVFRYEGEVQSTPPDGKSMVTHYQPGEVRYTKGDRIHSETLLRGRETAILLELK